ncbi:hypothetical protein AOQ84DRAFT_405576 [Glonium stellatum]|uniref:Uncharacterized protein n=1 Tax=Glonium stellatum TaxID=574774 RepID=A0A8E2JTX1_9PEZI|nr:hypothetical protein AOQ84DRAFT_405576 [Glonium stellatum]
MLPSTWPKHVKEWKRKPIFYNVRDGHAVFQRIEALLKENRIAVAKGWAWSTLPTTDYDSPEELQFPAPDRSVWSPRPMGSQSDYFKKGEFLGCHLRYFKHLYKFNGQKYSMLAVKLKQKYKNDVWAVREGFAYLFGGPVSRILTDLDAEGFLRVINETEDEEKIWKKLCVESMKKSQCEWRDWTDSSGDEEESEEGDSDSDGSNAAEDCGKKTLDAVEKIALWGDHEQQRNSVFVEYPGTIKKRPRVE